MAQLPLRSGQAILLKFTTHENHGTAAPANVERNPAARGRIYRPATGVICCGFFVFTVIAYRWQQLTFITKEVRYDQTQNPHSARYTVPRLLPTHAGVVSAHCLPACRALTNAPDQISEEELCNYFL